MTDEIDKLYNWMQEGVKYTKIDLTRQFYQDPTIPTHSDKYCHVNQWVTRLYRRGKLDRRYTGSRFVYFKCT